MDKYEQFQIEQSTLLKALAETGPNESLMRRSINVRSKKERTQDVGTQDGRY